MVTSLSSPPDTPPVSELSTPLTQSGRTSPTSIDVEVPDESPTVTQKKKKKKKSKKSAKSKDSTQRTASKDDGDAEGRPLCSGPWLQLPLELLDSLLNLNLDPGTLSGSETRIPSLMPPSPNVPFGRQRDRFHQFGNFTPPDSPHNTFAPLPPPPTFPSPKPGKATPPPIDPGVFRSVRNIRRLIDEAAELSVRASSGLSAAELGSMRSGSSLNNSPWAAAQSLGLNPLGGNNGGGRNVAMSPIRIHRLRALAVQKLAQAYRTDEIASSVMVMQGGSVFDDVAERVLKVDPNDADAKYVHFFHEKIPSRQLAESTTTNVLDELILAYPQHLEYYRTRGIVHCFRDEFSQATKDFTYALKEARAIRKAKTVHRNNSSQSDSRTNKQGKRRKGGTSNHTNGQAPPDGTSAMENGADGSDGEPLLKHASILEDAPDPIEPQLLFLRGAAYLQQAMHMIEAAVLKLEGVHKTPSVDGAELRLCYIVNGKYGGVEIGNPEGPLGRSDGEKLLAYSSALGEKAFRDYVTQLLKKGLRDHEKFLAHFDSLESSNAIPDGDLAFQADYAFLLSESMRPGTHANMPPPIQDAPSMFTTYHPLLVESYFSVLICQLMLAEFSALVPAFIRTASVVDGLEGYPIFLPPRSMAQAEFIEVLERLAGGWRNGTQPHSLSAQRGKCRLAIEGHHIALPNVLSSASYVDDLSPQPATSNGNTSQHATGRNAEEHIHVRADAAEALDFARILLAPVAKRQRERAEKAAADKAGAGSKKKPMTINIPLHGPRVEVILAWLGAVHLPELDGA
ncbi:hypothetical protein BJ912DRAFT_1137953 [Pholiota molesta]|nr:hypothetical protein BJ912DRAFT_1137953 [Pholiota molesta]